jgi:phosphoribosylformylglycinamidine synthase
MSRPDVLILRGPGTNCDEETAAAWEAAGATPHTWHVARLLEAPGRLDEFAILTIPGGFSYGDDLGAGRIFASRLGTVLDESMRRLRDRGGLILGICNGFQVLVRAGLLPGVPGVGPATLARNDSGRFESRWVRLRADSGATPFLAASGVLEMPVAHGEGRFLTASRRDFDALERAGRLVLRYVGDDDRPTPCFPANPNGSVGAVAGMCDATGQVFGLMPHPERNILPWHHPRWTRSSQRSPGDGLAIFRGAIDAMR